MITAKLELAVQTSLFSAVSRARRSLSHYDVSSIATKSGIRAEVFASNLYTASRK